MKRYARLICALLAGTLMFSVWGCGGDNQEQPQEKNKVQTISDTKFVTMGNGLLRLEFQKSDGSLVSFRDAKSELIGSIADSSRQDAIYGTPYGNFTLYVDVNAGDKWNASANPEKLVRVGSRSQSLKESNISDIDGGKRLTLSWDVSFEAEGHNYSGISVELTVDMFDGKPYSEWRYALENHCEGVTVVSLVAAQLGGIAPEKKFSLFYPMLEGEIHADAVSLAEHSALRAGIDGYAFGTRNSRTLRVSYPGSLSMQLVQLFNDEEGLYLFTEDDTNEFKRLNFGIFDGESGYDADCRAGASLSAEFYPFAEKGERAVLPTVIAGAQNEGGWYAGSDLYRAWKLTTPVRFLNYSDTVKNFRGLLAATATPSNGRPTFSYDVDAVPDYGNDISTMLAGVHNLGIHDMMLLGWSDDGFDTKYPDFNFMDAMGGETAFRSGVAKAQANGDRVYAYLNAYSVNGDSVWSRSGEFDKCAVKAEDGSYHSMGWGSFAFTAMCPMSDGYSKALIDAAARLAKNGVNGLFFDQLMEMPAELCFDRSHGHRTPATAYGEGYEKIFSGIHAEMKKYTEDYLFLCEGINDAYIKYVDVAGLMWGRPLKYRLNTSAGENEPAIYSMPEITRYTIPTKVLGLWNEDSAAMTAAEHACAYLMGNPILRQGGSTNPVMSKIISVYEKYPDLFSDSVYLASRGVTADDRLQVGVIAGEGRFLVSLYNPGSEDIDVSVRVDSAAVGYAGEVARVEDVLEIGISKRFKDGAFQAQVPAGNFVSYLITMK